MSQSSSPNKFWYQDSGGCVRGPFSNDQMVAGYQEAFFDLDTQILIPRRLEDLIMENGVRNPFDVASQYGNSEVNGLILPQLEKMAAQIDVLNDKVAQLSVRTDKTSAELNATGSPIVVKHSTAQSRKLVQKKKKMKKSLAVKTTLASKKKKSPVSNKKKKKSVASQEKKETAAITNEKRASVVAQQRSYASAVKKDMVPVARQGSSGSECSASSGLATDCLGNGFSAEISNQEPCAQTAASSKAAIEKWREAVHRPPLFAACRHKNHPAADGSRLKVLLSLGKNFMSGPNEKTDKLLATLLEVPQVKSSLVHVKKCSLCSGARLEGNQMSLLRHLFSTQHMKKLNHARICAGDVEYWINCLMENRHNK